MRKYEPIWATLRKDLKVTLAAPPQLHARIIKAVTKEKEKDYGFKLISSEAGKKYRLTYKSEQGKLTFTLTNIRITVEDL